MVRGCMARVLGVAVLVLVLAVAWFNRDDLGNAWDRLTGDRTPVSSEIAARADEKLAGLSEEGGADRVALTESELQSLLVYRWSGFLPRDVVSPTVELSDGRMSLAAGVATARFGEVSELRQILAFLPDTAELRAVGIFVPLDSGRVALEIHELGAASIPVPKQLIPTVLSRFGRGSGGGLAPNAVAVPLPPGIRNVYISGDSMIFVASRTGGA